MTSQSFEKHSASRPRKGARVIGGEFGATGIVTSVEDSICHVQEDNGQFTSFIWCFHDGLNSMHDWPTKLNKNRPTQDLLSLAQKTGDRYGYHKEGWNGAEGEAQCQGN